jgi:predicted enzyme related to lactoylglutathione lyase
MLSNSEKHANVPAGDLKRARAFYVDKLGLGRMAWFQDSEGNIMCLDERASASRGSKERRGVRCSHR